MKSANKLNADYTVIIGENELAAGEAQVRNMASKEQVSVPHWDCCIYGNTQEGMIYEWIQWKVYTAPNTALK